MNRRGFSLIELIVAIGIISILLAVGTISFSHWVRRQSIDRQVKEMYADIMYIRQQAMVTGRSYDAVVTTSKNMAFHWYSSEGESRTSGGTLVMRRGMSNAVIVSSTNPVEFNHRGVTVGDTIMCVFSDANPATDALVVTPSKVNSGRIKNQGSKDVSACTKNNIDLQ
jgi:prepilin-type N-terminal cleavage/methylation domain-containing protein